jgi:hypothetical protein
MRLASRVGLAFAMLPLTVVTLLAQQSRVAVFGGFVSSKFTNIELDEGVKHGGLKGFTAGIAVEKPIAAHIQFQPSLQFIQKGDRTSFSATESGITFDGSQKVTASYAQVALQLRASSNPDGTGFFGSIGPAIGILMRCRATSTITSNSDFVDDGTTTTDCKDNTQVSAIKSTDFAMAIGAGYAMRGMFVQARYDAGLNDINNQPGDDRSHKNMSLLLIVGLRF